MVNGRRPLAAAALAVSAAACAASSVAPTDPRVALMGRVDTTAAPAVRVGYPGVTFRVRFQGPALRGRFSASTAASRLGVAVDGGPIRVVRLAAGASEVPLADGLPPGEHRVDVVHRTETWQGVVTVHAFEAPGGRILQAEPWPARRLLFVGDSVTCGEAIDRAADCHDAHDPAATSNGAASYGMLVARALNAQVQLVCYGGRGLVRDWRGNDKVLAGPRLFDTALPVEARPVAWDHTRYVPDVVVVSLGTNDFNLDIGPFPERERFVSAYVAFVHGMRARFPNAHVLLTEGAIVDDEKDPARPAKMILREYIAETVRRVRDPYVEAVPATHYPGDACNAHPTRAEHEAMARDLEPIVRRAAGW